MNNNEKILHRIKNVAQILKCLNSSLDKLGEEVVNGMVNNSNGDGARDDWRTNVQIFSSVSASSIGNTSEDQEER